MRRSNDDGIVEGFPIEVILIQDRQQRKRRSMGYRTLADASTTSGTTASSSSSSQEVDPYLEVAAIQRRVYQAGGPALLFRRVKGRRIPHASATCSARSTARVPVPRHARGGPAPGRAEGRPGGASARIPGATAAFRARSGNLLPAACRSGPILAHQTSIDQLPQLQCWPTRRRSVHHAAAGLHRRPRPARPGPVQPGDVPGPALGATSTSRTGRSGSTTRSIAGIGVHHAAAMRRGEPFRVNVFVGGPPATDARRGHAAAGGPCRSWRSPEPSAAGGSAWSLADGLALPIAAEADFCICGAVDPELATPKARSATISAITA